MNGCSCKRVLDLLLDYVENFLPEAERAALDKHFVDCPPCLDFFKSYKAVPRLMRDCTELEMPKEVAERLGSFLAKKKT